jgi:hypothetical protein
MNAKPGWSWRTAVGALLLFVAMPLSARESVQVVNGVEVYLGVLPAVMIAGHPAEHPESGMHGGFPGGGYHVMVALFDAKTGKRITDAQVNAKVVAPSLHTVGKPLESMTVAGSLTYGNYFNMLRGETYRIDVEIRRRAAPGVIHATFHWAAV